MDVEQIFIFYFFQSGIHRTFIQNIHEYHSRKIYKMHNSTCTRKHSRQVKKIVKQLKVPGIHTVQLEPTSK